MQKSPNYIILIEAMAGSKDDSINPAKLAVRRLLDQLFDRAHRFRFCRLSQRTEEILGFDGKFH